jgi:hypothetical protein
VHIGQIPLPQAKLPLPQWVTGRILRHCEILNNLIEKSNEAALIVHQEILEESARRAAARQAASAAPQSAAPASPNPHHPAKPRPETPPETPPESPPETLQEPDPQAAPAPRPVPLRPEQVFNSLIRTIRSCIRLHAWLIDRLHRGHTTAEFAGLNHPSRQDILAYLHAAARAKDPHEDRRDLHQELETRVSEELGLFPARNPADIIADIATLYQLGFQEADFPNDWRCESFIPPGPEPEPLPPDYELTNEDIEDLLRCQDEHRAQLTKAHARLRYHRRE